MEQSKCDEVNRMVSEVQNVSGIDTEREFIKSFSGLSGDLEERFDLASSSMFDGPVRPMLKKRKPSEECFLCLSTARAIASKHLIVSQGDLVYLAVPKDRPLFPDQCMLVPVKHLKSSLVFPQSLREEMDVWKKRVKRMYHSIGQSPVFMETVIREQKHRHTFIECIPIPQEAISEAPIVFRQSIIDFSGDWRSNKGIIATDKEVKPVHVCVPDTFSYFHVEFEDGTGFVHPIDDAEFPRNFGKEVICAIVHEPSQILLRKHQESPSAQLKRVQLVHKLLNHN